MFIFLIPGNSFNLSACISLSKWPKPPAKLPPVNIHELRADAIADIRTFNDELSIWSIPSKSDEDIDEAILALATSIKQNNIDKIDVVVFSDGDISAKGLQLKDADGETAVSDLVGTHQNIVGLTYDSLTKVMELISDITISECHVRRNQRYVEKLIKNNLKRIDVGAFVYDDMKTKIMSLQ